MSFFSRMIQRSVTRVGIALSGGVDSSVAALLLKKQGYEVEGVYMRNWDERDEKGVCPSVAEYNDVKWVCQKIGIKCHKVEFIREYWNEVFSEFVSDYDQGLTPNPDVLCNQRIKFGVFHRYVLEKMKMDVMATGHYAQIQPERDGTVRLMQSVDKNKDQTYFLATVSQSALQRTLFPIGHLTKSQVRDIAKENGLEKIASKKESMGLCFIGKRCFSDFISEYLECRHGDLISVGGEIIGRHKGHQYYTVGQRARIGGMDQPWFVVGKNMNTNTVIVAPGPSHPALFATQLKTRPPSWIREKPNVNKELQARLRHQQKIFNCKIMEYGCGLSGNGCGLSGNGRGLIVCSSVPLRAITPGQYIVFYNGEECVGGAYINEVMAEKPEERKDKEKEDNSEQLDDDLRDGNTVNRRGQVIFVMRHGERQDSIDPTWDKKTDRPYDTPITGKGKVEAYNIALRRYGGKDINKVISSPFLRCLQTAQEVCKATGVVGVVTRNMLSEIMSKGAKMKDTPIVPPPNIGDYDIDIVEVDKGPLPPFPETLNESLKRIAIGVQEVADEFYPDNLVIVTHQYGVERSIYFGLGEDTPVNYGQFEAVYCGNVELVREGKKGEWKTISKHGIYEYDQLY